jgi:hypothetical protein
MTKPTAHFKSLLAIGVMITCGLLMAGIARADTVYLTLNGNLTPSVYAYYSYTVDGTTYGNYVAPYPTFLSDTPGVLGTTGFSICYDISNPTDVGKQYAGHYAYNTDTATLEATYLANLLNLDGSSTAPIAVKGAITYAIWAIMFPSSNDSEGAGFGVPDPAALPYEEEAAWAVVSGLWTIQDSNLYPTFMPEDTTSQRFGVILGPPLDITAPEPSGLALLGFGLLFLVVLWRRPAKA